MSGPATSGRSGCLQVDDSGAGGLRARGDLTEQGADLLYGTALALQGRGHDRVTVDLAGVQTADDAGLHALRQVQRELTTSGRELVLLHAPTGAAR